MRSKFQKDKRNRKKNKIFLLFSLLILLFTFLYFSFFINKKYNNDLIKDNMEPSITNVSDMLKSEIYENDADTCEIDSQNCIDRDNITNKAEGTADNDRRSVNEQKQASISENKPSSQSTILSNKKTYTISFNTNGGNAINSIVLNEGETVVELPTPIKDKYIFKEWQLNGKTFHSDTPITSNVTLEATYESFKIKLECVDEYSPDRNLKVIKDNGELVSYKTVSFIDGSVLCNFGQKINLNDLSGEDKVIVKLEDDTLVYGFIM